MRRRFTLWRGDERLGWFDERSLVHHHGRVVGASGILVPERATSALEAIMQSTVPEFPGAPTLQHPMPAAPPPSVGPRVHRAEALKPMLPGAEMGVPRERQFAIRSEDDEEIATRSIFLEEIAVPLGKGAEVGLPANVGSAWMVVFSRVDAI